MIVSVECPALCWFDSDIAGLARTHCLFRPRSDARYVGNWYCFSLNRRKQTAATSGS